MIYPCMKDLDIFATLPNDTREQIGLLAFKKIYQKNEIIFRQGMDADAIYLIKSGKVRLYKLSSDGREFTLDYLTVNDLFGEVTFFENTTHSLNAEAVEDTFICSCTRVLFLKLLEDPQTALKIIQYLGKKMNEYTEHMSRSAFMDVRDRVLSTLWKLAKSYGQESLTGTTLTIELTHQDIGCLVNASRVMVTNVLSELRKENVVHISGQKITLLTHDVQSI